METSITYFLLLFILVILLPINGVLSGNRIKKFLSENPESKLMFYQQTIIIQIILAILVFAAMAFNRDTIAEVGLSFLMHPLYVLGLLAVCVLGWGLLNIYPFDPEKLRQEIKKNAAIKFLLPSTNIEYSWSIGTSFAAGICEEIAFRGFLFWQLSSMTSIVPAILITNLAFGLCHFGTGFKNASLAFGLGVLLSIIYWYTGSLWIPMIIHVLTDIYSMTKGKRYFDQNTEERIVLD